MRREEQTPPTCPHNNTTPVYIGSGYNKEGKYVAKYIIRCDDCLDIVDTEEFPEEPPGKNGDDQA